MSLKRLFGTNSELVENGAWIDIVENDDGSMCKICIKRGSSSNKQFVKEIANHRKAFEKAQGRNISESKLTQMETSLREVVVSTVIVGWRNVVDWREGSQPMTEGFPGTEETVFLEYSKDNARLMLTEFPDLQELLLREAEDIANFQTKEKEIKN